MINGTLVADIREQQVYLDELTVLAPSINLTFEIKMLPTADYHVGSKLGIEFKSHGDFLRSIGDRLRTQTHELASQFERPIVLVTSTMSRLEDERGAEVIRGFVASLMIRQGVQVLFCGSDDPDRVPDNPVPMILKLAAKATTESTHIYNPLRRGGTKGEFGVGLIASLPGIGPRRAQTIIKHFGTPLDALVNVDTWNTINGIGAKTIERCMEVLTAVREDTSTEQDWGGNPQEET